MDRSSNFISDRVGLVVCILISIYSPLCQAAHNYPYGNTSYTMMKTLKDDILVSYDQSLRPKLNQTDLTSITMQLSLNAIYAVNEISETFTACGYVGVEWYDELLPWDPPSYENITYVTIPKKEIWDPEFVLVNSVENVGPMGSDELLVETWYDGWTIRWTYHIYTATCSLDITYYPFDEHDCTLDFSMTGYTVWEVEMNVTGSSVFMGFFNENSEWIISPNGQDTKADSGDPNMTFKFHLKRRPGYVVLSIIMPVVMLSVLNLAVFLLPSNGGEKAGFAITCLLSFTVFMTVILSTFPRNALVVSVFAIYLLILTLDSTIIAILALVLVRIVTFDDTNKPVYSCVLRFYNFFRCASCKSKNNDTEVVKIQVDKNGNSDQDRLDKNAFFDDDSDAMETTWLQIANFFDLFFLIVFSVILFLSTVIYFAVAAS
ncbi:Neuronal acetylcholine receptor subunit alpha-4 [Mactra antiquata]